MNMLDARGHVDRGAIRGDVQMFRHMLTRRYGNLVAGWRGALDQDGSGSVSRQEFISAAKGLNFPGDAQAVFAALAETGEDEMSLFSLDKEAAELLSEFALFIRDEFGTVDEAFTSGLAWGGRYSDCIEFQTFMHACLEMRFRSANFKRLFQCLDFDGNGFLSLDELRFLETWRADIFEHPPSLDERLADALQCHRPLDEVCALVEAGANPNKARNPGHVFTDDGNNALSQAAERGTVMQLQRILACRADPRLTNAFGRTPLHSAAARQAGRVDPTLLIQHLCMAKADASASTADGTTPLHIACGAGQASSVAMLGYMGADVNAHDAQNRNPLWLSVFRKSVPCCQALLESLADPCRRSKGDRTPLAMAIQNASSRGMKPRQDALVEIMTQHVQVNYEVLMKAAARDLEGHFEEMLYLELLEHLPQAHLEELLSALDYYLQTLN